WTFRFELLNFGEDALDQSISSIRRAAKIYRDFIFRRRDSLIARPGADAVSSAHLFANYLEQAALKNLRHRPNGDAIGLIEFKRATEDDRGKALGLNALFDFLYDYVIRCSHPDVLPAFLAPDRRQ